jgi:uncharacterized protein (TIGR00251 family)
VSKGFLAATKDGTLLTLRASPGAKRTSIEGLYGQGALKLRVAAPPVDGKANAEVERFLARLLGVPRSDVVLIQGSSSRDKVVLVRGLDQRETHNALLTHLS